MPEQPKICYLLGAGASYNSLPLVNEIAIDLERMLKYLCDYNSLYLRTFDFDLNRDFKQYHSILSEIKEHFSVDTLARKYWLIKNNIVERKEKQWWENRYIRLKNIIACLITFRRLKLVDYSVNHNDILIESYTDSYDELGERISKSRKSFKIDPRYDALFSAILSPNLSLPENIKIISWNYDFQIEQSFNFFQSHKSLKETGNQLGIDYSKESIGPIVKLNGSAILYNGATMETFKEYDRETHQVFINALKDSSDPSIYSGIKFSWEQEGFISTNRILAANYIAECDYVVSIGYSFPIFNRETDIQIFENFGKIGEGKIFIQAPEPDAIRFKGQLESIKEGLSKDAEIVTNLDQFFVPNQFWKPESGPIYA
ncbi:MAG: hypothetical protein Q8M15_10565 [Bacteroidota bacterium]|nr:hypothetical protein [Bacteroidota bacterium]